MGSGLREHGSLFKNGREERCTLETMLIVMGTGRGAGAAKFGP